MFVKRKAYFNPLVDVVATQGVTNTCFSNEKISNFDRHMNNNSVQDSKSKRKTAKMMIPKNK